MAVAGNIYYQQLWHNYFVRECCFITITISVPLCLRLQVGQVGVQGHGSSQSGRFSLSGKHRPKLFQKRNVDFSVMDRGKQLSWENKEEEETVNAFGLWLEAKVCCLTHYSDKSIILAKQLYYK